jgi:hypothetical protein
LSGGIQKQFRLVGFLVDEIQIFQNPESVEPVKEALEKSSFAGTVGL